MKRVFLLLAAVAGAAAALALATLVWWLPGEALDGRQSVDSRVAAFEVSGTNAGRGNFVAVQPWMVGGDYANRDTLFAKLDGYFAAARARGWLNGKTIVVLPEYIGTWLVAANEPASAYREAHIERAMTTMALAHAGSYLRWRAAAPNVSDKARWAMFTLKSEPMARDYQSVFGALAKKYGVTLVAGSIVLPKPRLANGRIAVTPGGTLYNVSAVFGPDGRILPPLVVKAYPIEEEKVFTASGRASDIPVFATAAGRLAVLICADSWYAPVYRRIAAQQAELVAIPSYSSDDNSWAERWQGYNGAPTPADVDHTDIGKITEGQAWLKYSMGGRAAAAKIRAGVNVFLRGGLWDTGSDGRTIYFRNATVARAADRHGAVLFNQWL